MDVIQSLENKHIKNVSKLLVKKYRDDSSLFLVEGEHLVEEAYRNHSLVEVIKCEDCLIDYSVKKTLVTYDILKKLCSTKTPQKIIGVCKKQEEKEIGEKVLILDAIQDPGNLGTIIRSSVAFGIDTIILSMDCVDLYNDKVIRASEGVLFKQNILKRNLEEVISYLKKNHYTIFGTKVDGGTPIGEVDYPDKFAMVMGNEGSGVRDSILSLCDIYLYIPMLNQVESLNVGVATSIILYEMARKNNL